MRPSGVSRAVSSYQPHELNTWKNSQPISSSVEKPGVGVNVGADVSVGKSSGRAVDEGDGEGEGIAAADTALTMMQGVTPTAFVVIAYLQLAMTYLMAWEDNQSASQPAVLSPQSSVLKKQAWQTIKVLHRFHIGKPAAWLCQGWYEQLRGRTAQAMKLWHKGLDAAAKLQTPYEQALLHYHMGRHLPTNHPTRANHLSQAHTLFTHLGTTYELALLEQI